MAKQRFGINDAYRGTVGTVIGYEWRGRWCLRAKPLRVHNPRTARQQSNRQLFKQIVQLAGSMKKALRKGLHTLSMKEHITECNYFVKYNKECFSFDAGRMPAVQEEESRIVVDWERLIISEGSVVVPVFGEGQTCPTSPTGPTILTVGFQPHVEGERASGDDEVYLYAYCPELGEGVLGAPAYRKTGRVSLELPERWQGKDVHLYGFAVDYAGNASATTYIGKLESSSVETQHAASLQTGVSGSDNDRHSSSFSVPASSALGYPYQCRFLYERRE